MAGAAAAEDGDFGGGVRGEVDYFVEGVEAEVGVFCDEGFETVDHQIVRVGEEVFCCH